jgi:hypothetical protein
MTGRAARAGAATSPRIARPDVRSRVRRVSISASSPLADVRFAARIPYLLIRFGKSRVIHINYLMPREKLIRITGRTAPGTYR